MNWMDGFNKIVNYIEDNLENEIDYSQLANILGYSVYHFQRLFMMIAGVPIAEYIRSRRLAKAAVELQTTDNKVIDVAIKYSYSSAGAFNRAFKKMHQITPSDVKRNGVTIKAYPPLSFSLTIKGTETMDYRIEEKKAFRVVGLKLTTTAENGKSYKQIPALWGEIIQSGQQNSILALMNQEPYGFLGVSDYDPELETSEFDYYIACPSDMAVPDGMSEYNVPAATWAIFSCENVRDLQKLQQQIVMDWLPTSGYEFGHTPDIEFYHVDGIVDVWLPVINRV